MLSMAQPTQWASTSTFGSPVARRMWATASGMSARPTSSMVHGRLAVGMPQLVRRSSTQTSRPRLPSLK